MPRRPLSQKQAEDALRGPRGDAFFEALRRLPDDVDTTLAAGAVLGLLEGARSKGCWLLGRNGQRLPAAVIHELLPHLREAARTAGHEYRDTAIFLSALVSTSAPAPPRSCPPGSRRPPRRSTSTGRSICTSLRGKKRTALREWLLSASVAES